MKKKKWLFYSIPIILVIIIVAFIIYGILTDEKRLTSEERKWINNNINTVQNIYVIKDENIFSKDDKGVFYNFLNDFSENYGIKLNIITTNEMDNNDNKFNVTKTLNEDNHLFYQDHYVLVGKENEIISDYISLQNKKVGILNSDLEYVNNHLKSTANSLNGYDTLENLVEALNKENVNYLILPRMRYLDIILNNNLNIIYHFSDINLNYVFQNNDTLLGSILSKYFIKWEENINKTIKEQEFAIFQKSLNITPTAIDELLSVDYRYGFINNSPYEVIMSGNYGGIIAEYLQEFSKFSGVYFDITKYKNTEKLARAINNSKVDLYFDFNNKLTSTYESTANGIKNSLSILTTKDNVKAFNSVYGLIGETVYVESDSNLLKYLQSIGGITIETYDTPKELFKLNKTNNIIVMDTYIYDYYSDSKLNNYVSKYDTLINYEYGFKIKPEYKTLNLLLDKYISYLDNLDMINKGINSHTETVKSGMVLNNIAKYFIMFIILVVIISLVVYRNSKKIRLSKKIKNTDKIRFVDDLTCLKNRTYLSDFMKTWNNNTIYPQAVIVLDLNDLKEINNQYGVEEGDKQIQAAANALIKTQLDNSDLMRSDGNEFVVYTVGYNRKQIANYIHKLSKELKRLPYNYGAEFGISFIENNLKTIEDALTEAINDMKSKKVSKNEK